MPRREDDARSPSAGLVNAAAECHPPADFICSRTRGRAHRPRANLPPRHALDRRRISRLYRLSASRVRFIMDFFRGRGRCLSEPETVGRGRLGGGKNGGLKNERCCKRRSLGRILSLVERNFYGVSKTSAFQVGGIA